MKLEEEDSHEIDEIGSTVIPPQNAETVIGKVNRNVLPLLCMIVVCCYLDRTSLAFASVQLTKVDLFNSRRS